MLTFDEASHTYKWQGVHVPNVTSVIDLGFDFRFVKPDVLERARRLGTAVHKTVELAEHGKLDESKTHPTLLKYLAQWRDFKETMKFVPKDMGIRGFCERYGFAGTDDVYGTLDNTTEILIDLKTGDYYPPHELQTAAYKEIRVLNRTGNEGCWRGSLYLSEDSYQLKFHRDTNDRAVFLGLLSYWKWKQAHGK